MIPDLSDRTSGAPRLLECVGSSLSLVVEQSQPLMGEVTLEGAKNAALVIIASLLLTDGVSTLRRIPTSADVWYMIHILEMLGARIHFHEAERMLVADTRGLRPCPLDIEIMGKFRASTLVLGPLLARFGEATIAFPGGDIIGKRPIDLHIHAFEQMGARIVIEPDNVHAYAEEGLRPTRIVLNYPSVGATENILMAATLIEGSTTIINAALEPEVLDVIEVLRAMGADIHCGINSTIHVRGVKRASCLDYAIMYDRLEAGTYLLAAAITKGSISIPQAPVGSMAVFLEALRNMGHIVEEGDSQGVTLQAALHPKAISLRTMPYPGFPTDLQAPMLVAQTLARGTSIVHETVYESRFGYVRELQRLGAQIVLQSDSMAIVQGGAALYGAPIIAGDIRAAAGLTLAGLVAQGKTTVFGAEHILRGYVNFVEKLRSLGATITLDTQSVKPTHQACVS
jgi:UDP-N-acetylglucosamine 1-carboxyvinyltransferase